MTEEIFKVQLPVRSNMTHPPAYIYNREKTIMLHVPNNGFIQAVMRGEPKKYVYGYLKNGDFVFTREADWQDW